MRILNVAEKNSVAREIGHHLSSGSAQRRGGSQFVVDFPFSLSGRNVQMTVTAVRGHLMEMDFGPEYKSWTTVDPAALFACQVHHKVSQADIARSLRDLARQADWLVLWLDCDREGEAIAFEVLDVCLSSNRNLQVFRARFSALTLADLTRAVNNLGLPNQYLSEAVLARSEIDLRVGAAFTRWLTLRYQGRLSGGGGGQNEKRLVSFGGCQTVTLGFVVARWLARERFVPESFWALKLTCQVPGSPPLPLLWNRTRIFDQHTAEAILTICRSVRTAEVTQSTQQPKSKWRPLPLNTLEMTKIAASHLRLPSHRCMQIAEHLYSKGFVSYPRTETDMFHPTMDLPALVGLQQTHSVWGPFARSLVEGRFVTPRQGRRDDQAHPPIHPLKAVERGELDSQEEFDVYQLIARHFLACCAPDAQGSNTHVEVKLGTELFHADGLQVLQLNWLEVYPYTRWVSTTMLPECRVGDRLAVQSLEGTSGSTEAPDALTESEALSLMDKEGIGTDATMHEHIRTIQERGYCHLDAGRYFIPSPLGVALIVGLGAYEGLGFHLAKPTLRAAMESDMGLISQGAMTRAEFISRYALRMKEIFTAICDNPFPLDTEINAITNTGPPGGGGGGWGGGGNGGSGGAGGGGGGGGFATVRSTHFYPDAPGNGRPARPGGRGRGKGAGARTRTTSGRRGARQAGTATTATTTRRAPARNRTNTRT